MTSKKNKKRITQLEVTVKHLILSKQNDEALEDRNNEGLSLEGHYRKHQDCNNIFLKFLDSLKS